MPSSLFLQRHQRWLLILGAGLVPIILGMLFTAVEARHSLRNQQTVTANALITQTETLSDSAMHITRTLRDFKGQTCLSLERPLQRLASRYPYFRAIGVLDGSHVSCSSAYGHDPGELNVMIQHALPQSTGNWGISIAGTSAVPERPAIAFVWMNPEDFGVYAIVEGQYLLDFMRAVSEARHYQLKISFNGGYTFVTGQAQRTALLPIDPVIWHAASSRYPFDVTVLTPASEALRTWRDIFLIFLPMIAILSLLFMVITANWIKRRVTWRDRIKKAMQRDEFSVAYQPVCQVSSGCCSGVEALMRWQRRDGEWERPDIFIAAAEEENMIIPLTRHLLTLLARDVESWQVTPGFHLALNVAAEHLQHPDFVPDIEQFAREIAHKQLQITLELTERSLIKEGDAVAKKLAWLRQCGIKVAIDDFGTGNCSLSYLQTFELDYLKIDRGFINPIESIDGETPVLDAIISLSHKLALNILGEGVETEMQYRYLSQRGVAFVQGWYYARPMTSDALRSWLMTEGATPLELNAS